MTAKDIIALANAGFTAQQIAQLEAANRNPLTEEKHRLSSMYGESSPDSGKQETTPPPAPAQQAIATPGNDPIAALMNKLDTLTSAVQAGAIAHSEQPPVQTVDQIIASIINPPMQDGATK